MDNLLGDNILHVTLNIKSSGIHFVKWSDSNQQVNVGLMTLVQH